MSERRDTGDMTKTIEFEGNTYECVSRMDLDSGADEQFVARDGDGAEPGILGDFSLWIINGRRVALDDAE